MHSIVIPSHGFLIDTFLRCRRDVAFRDQVDYFDHPNCIAWSRSGDDEHPEGMVVVISNGDGGSKRVQIGKHHDTYRDATSHIQEAICTVEEGWAEFQCPARSLSVWIPESVSHDLKRRPS